MSKQKIVVKVCMPHESCRTKAREVAAKTSGVISLAITGDDKDKLEVVGVGVDVTCLVVRLRKKVGPADVVQVEEVKEKPPEEKKPEEPPKPVPWCYPPPPPYYCPPPPAAVWEEPSPCSIM
uniref:HMA domain-containing protein n=1 Tax=Leersia perrieri TaxID=77586 RepID=A0A0D9W5W9_9ORYZ